MIRKNVFQAPKEMVEAHHGQGKIAFIRPFDDPDFETHLSFVDYVEIPPGASIGVHTHGENEEIYFIVHGTGTMTTNADRFVVVAGDLIVNKRGWSHGLENTSNAALKVLVWETAYTPPSA